MRLGMIHGLQKEDGDESRSFLADRRAAREAVTATFHRHPWQASRG